MLSISQMNTISKQILLKITPSEPDTDEMAQYRKEVTEEIKEMKAKGIVCEMVLDFD